MKTTNTLNALLIESNTVINNAELSDHIAKLCEYDVDEVDREASILMACVDSIQGADCGIANSTKEGIYYQTQRFVGLAKKMDEYLRYLKYIDSQK